MKLFEPITVRGMTIRNRIVMSSMGVGLGYTNRRVLDFYTERARGGVGAIIVGAAIPDLFWSDEAWGKAGGAATFITRLKTLTGAVNGAGARIGVQFVHGNRYPMGLDFTKGELAAPSARVEPDPSRHAFVKPGEAMRELTAQEIASIVEGFGRAAAGAREAGFDFAELHSGHGMLVCQFFSPTTNLRTDRYGGDSRRRMTFALESIRAMRRAAGDDFPLFSRQGVVDVVPDGFGLEEGLAFACEMEKAGVDVLNVSIGTPPFCGGYVPAGEDPEGTHVHLAQAVKQRVNVPVIGVGRIRTPAVAEAILAEGKADLVAVGRQLFADPGWPAKAAAGNAAGIVPCIDCHECYERATAANGMECTVNDLAGHEGERRLEPAGRRKRVLVVGGGPAGLEAARVAAMRGHDVTLREKGRRLGGALLLQAILPSKEGVEELSAWYAAQLQAGGVKVELGVEATPASVRAARPDVVIVATGARPLVPAIRGIERGNVVRGAALRSLLSGGNGAGPVRPGWRGLLVRIGAAVTPRRLSLRLRKRLARIAVPIIFGRSAVVAGGDMASCQLADFLSETGLRVSLVATAEEVATDMVSTLRLRLLDRLRRKGVTIVRGALSYEEITERGLSIVDAKGERQTVEADTVLPMAGFAPDEESVHALKDTAPEVLAAGDCAEPLKLLHAIHDGARAGRAV